MSTLRRSVPLTAVATVTLVTLTASPALATFSDTATIPTSVGTLTVAAPTNVSTAGTWCDPYDMHAKVSWKASTTREVTGYAITALAADGSTLGVFDVGPSTSLSYDVDRRYGSQGIRLTVTTVTSYGWTATSAKTGALQC